MSKVEILYIKIITEGVITGEIEQYKYNMNTNLKSKISNIYVPIKYNLKQNASNNPNLKNISLYTDKSKLEEIIKDDKFNIDDKSNIDVLNDNIKFIVKLLFKKNSKFFIKKWQFLINKTPEDNDIIIPKKISIKSNKIQSDALKKKYEEIKKEVELPYLSIINTFSSDYKKQFQRNLDREIISRYNNFLLNKKDREEWINNYKLKIKSNKTTVTLTLVAGSLELINWINRNNYITDLKYKPPARDCKTRKKYIYDEFIELLCESSEIPDDTPEMKKYKKGINKVRRVTRKHIANPSKDIPACKKYKIRKDFLNKSKKKLTIKNLKDNISFF